MVMTYERTIGFYSLGYYWRALCVSVALTLHCFGQCNWSQSDIDYLLYRVDDIRTYTGTIDQQMDDINSDTTAIKFLLERIDDSSADVISAINHNTTSLSNLLNRLTFDSVNQLRVSDTGVLAKATSIDSKMDRLEQAIYSLTNYMCYSSEYTSTFNSNIAYLVTSYFGGDWPPYNVERQLNFMSEFVEIGDYGELWRRYGIWRAFPAMLFSVIDSDAIPSSYFSDLETVWRTLFRDTGMGYDSYRYYYDSISKPISYQYGTRQLTDITLGISNVLALANQTGIQDLDDSLSTHTVYSGSGQPSTTTTSLFGRVSGAMGKTFGIYGEPAATNDVTSISDPTLAENKNSILSDQINGSLSDGVGVINSSAIGVIDDLFEGRNVTGKFVVPGFTIQQYNFTFQDVEIDPADYSLSHAGMIWCFNAVRALCLVGFVISSIWRIVSTEQKLNAPDPF